MRWNGVEWCYPGLFGKTKPKRQPRRRAWYRAAEVAQLIGVTAETVRDWTKAGKLPAERTPTGRYRYAASDLMRWLSKRAAA